MQTIPTKTDAEASTPDDQRTHLHALLAEFSTLMLVTQDDSSAGPALNGRPMAVAKLEDDCTLVFVTGVNSMKVKEALEEDGAVVGQTKLRQVSLAGRFSISRDRARIAAVWSKAFDVWFPGGKDDPNACLIIFTPHQAELWDSSGAKGLKYLFDSAKALITREPPRASVEQHEKLKLKNS